MAKKVGFIGLGDIGMPMGQRVIAAGFDVYVWGRNKDRLKPALDDGATLLGSAADVARTSEVVFLCLSDTNAVEEVVFGAAGIAEGVGEKGAGKIVIDLSTSHPIKTKEMADRLRAETGMGWLDAPVSGGPTGAAAGTLAVMVGGSDEDFAKGSPVIGSFAGRITHMGENGCGQVTKLCNQLISFSAISGICEALTLGHNYGIDVSKLPEAVSGGWADSRLLRHYMPLIVEGKAYGHTRTAAKDMGIACEVARATGKALPVGEVLLGIYRRVMVDHPDAGMSAPIYELVEPPLRGK
ncbi:MAG: NAD(P)-dependent oxidoreductase [Rhodobiaceae bacterium]|nr:NAD(P)-dependent oxidoreductase [Rhodobiaceae bacterium]MCC0054746.1 NAD(P)-dependent oxidoreductase [Rhodobiaceae bacterium]